MSVEKTIPYVSLRDIVVPTLDGYALRFESGVPTQVPNFKHTIAAVQAAGCVPADEVKVRVKSTTVEEATEAEQNARRDQILVAIGVLKEKGDPIDFNRTGSPQVRSLEAITGFKDISNAERDKAWKAFQASENE